MVTIDSKLLYGHGCVPTYVLASRIAFHKQTSGATVVQRLWTEWTTWMNASGNLLNEQRYLPFGVGNYTTIP